MTCTMTVGKSGIYTGNTGIRPPRFIGLRGRSAASAVNGEYCRRAIAAGDDATCHHDSVRHRLHIRPCRYCLLRAHGDWW